MIKLIFTPALLQKILICGFHFFLTQILYITLRRLTQKNTFSRTLSLERLPDLSGDVLFYNVGGAGQGEVLREEAEGVVDGPLWREVPAVRGGEAHGLDPDHWMVFGGLRSANLVLDDVEKHLT